MGNRVSDSTSQRAPVVFAPGSQKPSRDFVLPIVGSPTMVRAVLWDFGGVILTSPFDAFNDYEAAHNLPADFIRSVNTHNPDSNAWALLERE